jgi:adenylate cyclase class 2
MLEVEIKVRIDIEEVKGKLSKLGAKFIKDQHQLDTYFHHPCRDFKKTDEAMTNCERFFLSMNYEL